MTASPHFSHKNKATDSLLKLPVVVTGMIAYGHGEVRYLHYALDIYPSNSNHTVGSIVKLLQDLESPPIYLLNNCSLEVAHLPCFKQCSLGLICARIPFLLQ